MTGSQKRRLRGLIGRVKEAEREARSLGHDQRAINRMAVEARTSWPSWARSPAVAGFTLRRVLP